jgi:hypothetical protein
MIRYLKTSIPVALVGALLGFLVGMYFGGRGIPFVEKNETAIWSIGIYAGESPLDVSETMKSPVLTANHVTDVPASFVADPFMLYENHTWYMFFEVLNGDSGHGDIGLATSDNGLDWTYQQIVLNEPFHLSYPHVLKWEDQYYMIPESGSARSIRLYKATDFPTQWSFVGTLLYGKFADPSVFNHDDKWWMFAGASFKENDLLLLFYADDLAGPWIEHPRSPIIEGDANIARPGGRVQVIDDRILRYAQDDDPTYGNQVRAFEITELTTTSYAERQANKSPLIGASGTGWNSDGMHHIDLHQTTTTNWIAAVDGYRWEEKLVFGLRY